MTDRTYHAWEKLHQLPATPRATKRRRRFILAVLTIATTLEVLSLLGAWQLAPAVVFASLGLWALTK